MKVYVVYITAPLGIFADRDSALDLAAQVRAQTKLSPTVEETDLIYGQTTILGLPSMVKVKVG